MKFLKSMRPALLLSCLFAFSGLMTPSRVEAGFWRRVETSDRKPVPKGEARPAETRPANEESLISPFACFACTGIVLACAGFLSSK